MVSACLIEDCGKPMHARGRCPKHYALWRETPEARYYIEYRLPENAQVDLPEPMPARTAAGEQVWLHYWPLRWERHP